MRKKRDRLNQKGFTLIELISVMIIMGVVASVSIKKFDIVSNTAGEKALQLGIKELNIRESLTWSNIKISSDGYTNDADLWSLLEPDLDLGGKYHWNPGPDIAAGGTLHFDSNSIALNRQPSTMTSAGKWSP
ncbi:MAG: prepilin-type N-terminal cleavage/methylation domain-containing protein [Desulfobacterales bacterium]|jgi:prepilin-type N-terminal cleavage/methylation domain-containing protein